MDFYKKVEIFEVRGTGSHPKTISVLIKRVMCIAICIVFIATCWHRSWFWGSRQIYIVCTMDFYKKVEIFEVRVPGSHPKPLSILIKLGICIAI